MKKTKKIVALLLAAVMLVCTTVAATVAYLQSQTAVITNTMTIGKVVITLTEAPVDEDGQEKSGDRVITNSYKLYPGKEYDKDPTVFVDKDSEDCYVFVKVVNGIENIESTEDNYVSIADQLEANGWVELSDEENVYYYEVIASANDELVLFENFTIDADLDYDDYKDYQGAEIEIEAFAVQEEGFADAVEAWGAAKTEWEMDK